MSEARSALSSAPAAPAFFRHREVGGSELITNMVGQHAFLSKSDFEAYRRGQLDPTHEQYGELVKKNFFRDQANIVDLGGRLQRKRSFLGYGPNLHIMVVTLRCNETCVYCHASRAGLEEVGKDMSEEDAEKVVDLILQTTNPYVTIEFQGGEPLVNYPVVQHIIEYALEQNKAAGKQLEFSLITNLSLMDEEKMNYLLDHKVQICTSVDGPRDIHNKQRILNTGDAWELATTWIERINREYVARGLDPEVYHVEALITSTRALVERPKEVVDTYVDLGCRALFLRPVDPFGFASKTQKLIGYEVDEFLEYYRSAVDYMLELNFQGVQILERYAAIFLTKILTGDDPNFLDIRNPCGAGIGQLAYNYDGRVFVCDEGRMVSHMGDDFFEIGVAGESSYESVVTHDTVKACTMASNLDSIPGCNTCAYNPYCGTCPVYNYSTQGSLHGRMPESRWCAVHMGIQDYLFEKLRENDPKVMAVFDKWVHVRERDFYLHDGAEEAAAGAEA